MGKTEVEDALARLDMLTQEENLMTVARTLEATHDINVNVKATQELTRHVDTVLQQVDRATQDNTVKIQELTSDVHADVGVIMEGTRTIDENVQVTKGGAPIFQFQFLHTHTD